jgi:hypothetical protein
VARTPDRAARGWPENPLFQAFVRLNRGFGAIPKCSRAPEKCQCERSVVRNLVVAGHRTGVMNYIPHSAWGRFCDASNATGLTRERPIFAMFCAAAALQQMASL